VVATTLVNRRYDEASKDLREVLGQLEGLNGALEWIDTLSRPSGDGPIVKDEAAMRGYSAEVLLALAKALLAQQERVSALEDQLQERTRRS
jgi:hypothetical protein